MRKGTVFITCTLLAMLLAGAAAAQMDRHTVWPLCGRITENPPQGWVPADGCPAGRQGDPGFTDAPFSATFGPRLLYSGDDRYDFHRGVDIATPIGTPIFAIDDGKVEIAGHHSSYTDPLIKIRHYRPGENTCSNGGGCYYSFYLHLRPNPVGWVVAVDEQVQKGQLIGYSGESGSGFDHLHFEVRDAPAFDAFSAWQRDCVHPFTPLPYGEPNHTSVTFNSVDNSDQNAVVANVRVLSNRYDLVSVEMSVFDGNNQEVVQAGNTPDGNGYHVAPPFWDMETWNFEYSHKNSSSYPWASFGLNGANECPYYLDHGPNYSAHVHMDQQDPGDMQKGLFNGVQVTTNKYWLVGDRDYEVNLEFRELQGPASCIEASAVFASGVVSTGRWGSCPQTCTANKAITANQWNSFTLPCDPGQNKQVQHVFDDLVAADYGVTWVVYAHDTVSNTYEIPAIDDPLWPGQAYWIYTLNASTIDYNGFINAANDLPLPAHAQDGRYNFVGNFHNTVVDWPDAQAVVEGVTSSISAADPQNDDPPPVERECDMSPAGDDCLLSRVMYKWSGSNYNAYNGETPGLEGNFQPGDAFWTRAFRPGVRLRLNTPQQQGDMMAESQAKYVMQSGNGNKTKATEPADWYIRLVASSGDKSDQGNVLGQLKNASDGLDGNDLEEWAPFGDSYLSLLFENAEFPDTDWGYTSDFRALSKTPGGTWHILVRASTDVDEITLTWEGQAQLLHGARLRDRQTGTVTALKPGGSYTFENRGGESRFDLYIRNKKFPEKNRLGQAQGTTGAQVIRTPTR